METTFLVLALRVECSFMKSPEVVDRVCFFMNLLVSHRGSWMGFSLASFFRFGSSMNCGIGRRDMKY